MKNKIALFVCDPKCSVQSTNGVMNALSPHFNFKLFSKNEVEEGFFDDVDMVIVPVALTAPQPPVKGML